MQFDPVREASELRSQLASDKRRLAFFLGAGTSQAVGIPGLNSLTSLVDGDLPEGHRATYRRLLAKDEPGTIETVLNRVRLLREMLGRNQTLEIEGLTADGSRELDR